MNKGRDSEIWNLHLTPILQRELYNDVYSALFFNVEINRFVKIAIPFFTCNESYTYVNYMFLLYT